MSEPSLVVDDGGDLVIGEEGAEVRHATALHGLARVEAGAHGGCTVADAAGAVRLAEVGALGDEVDLAGGVRELPEGGAVGQVRSVGAATGRLRLADGPSLGVAPGAVHVEQHLPVDRALALGL